MILNSRDCNLTCKLFELQVVRIASARLSFFKLDQNNGEIIIYDIMRNMKLQI